MDVRRSLMLVAALGSAWTLAGAQGTWRVSVDSSGVEGDFASDWPSLSRDSRFVAFGSRASNLVPGDTNAYYDVFVHDRQNGTTTRVSVDSSGQQANGGSYFPSISADGRFVEFESDATNLVPGDISPHVDVFIHDRQTGITTRVSVDSSGAQANSSSYRAMISADGHFVTFDSDAANLVPGDFNDEQDVFVHDCQTGMTIRVSVDSSGVEGNDSSLYSSISGDGRFVAFGSFATNLVPGDTNRKADVFVHDHQTGATTRVSVNSSGGQANNSSFVPSISADGRFVAFESDATNLVVDDTNGYCDVFRHDRQTGRTRRVSVDSSGNQGNDESSDASISADGRFVAFQSLATNLAAGDINRSLDAFRHDRQTGVTTLVSVNSSGIQGRGDSCDPSIAGDGRSVAFASVVTTLVSGDTNGVSDVFVHGPYLTLEANPETVSTGDTLALTTWKGLVGACALLTAVDLNGTPLWTLAIDIFDAGGLWTLSGTVPPGLSGNVVTFLSIGFAPTGELELSNLEVVAFQ